MAATHPGWRAATQSASPHLRCGLPAIVDLPWISAMVMGLDDWDVVRCRTIHEERLLAAVRRQVGEQVERLVAPPRPDSDLGRPSVMDDLLLAFRSLHSGYMRCPLCERLAPRMRDISTRPTLPPTLL